MLKTITNRITLTKYRIIYNFITSQGIHHTNKYLKRLLETIDEQTSYNSVKFLNPLVSEIDEPKKQLRTFKLVVSLKTSKIVNRKRSKNP